MNSSTATSSPAQSSAEVPSPQKTLHRLFLTLFLRGRTSRGLQTQDVPGSIGQKLARTLGLYALIGLVAFGFSRLPIFALSVYLHGSTFAFLGMFLASSAGEVLFNKDEAEILLHRPISPRTLLWTKIRVLLEASLWLAGAFNLAGFVVGLFAADGGWRFLVAHVVSVGMEALFCAACVVMVYQLCLRWFGRERLEGLITTSQVILSVGAVLGSQILPQLILRENTVFYFSKQSWWIALLPPAWFAGFDDAISGTKSLNSWLLAAIAVIATLFVLWIAFAKLAHDYETGLQRLSETVSMSSRKRAGRRRIDDVTDSRLLRWWLRDPVARASFGLAVAYLVRDRDVKLRIFPAVAPMMALPLVLLIQDFGRPDVGSGGFGVAFAGSYLSVLPMMALNLLQYSQQWQASEIFRVAPLPGPAALCSGARKAILCILALPTIYIFALTVLFMRRDVSQLLLLLPGIVALPVYALIPCLGGNGVPLSLPTEEAKGAGHGLTMVVTVLPSFAIAGLAAWSWSAGWFHWFMLAETLVAIKLYAMIRITIANRRWPTWE